jgi:hypothetical protein
LNFSRAKWSAARSPARASQIAASLVRLVEASPRG